MTMSNVAVAVLPLGLGGYIIPSLIKYFNPIEKSPLRDFNVDALKGIGGKYITYYDIDNKNRDLYPTKEIHYEDTSYNEFQINFLIRFANSQLTTPEAFQLRKDESIFYDKSYIDLNSTQLQDGMKKNFKLGLTISNLLHNNPKNKHEIIYPYKFKEILDLMTSTKGSVILYSHFYHNGLLLFKQYLDSQGHGSKYEILHPDLPSNKFEDIVDRYNAGKTKILLLHPEITEGASFLGTRQLHILETPYNKSLQEQIIGRVIRYRSHMHLQENERHVDIHIWNSTFGKMDLAHGAALRSDWQHNFSELNYYGERTLVDFNNKMKSVTPDEVAHVKMNELDESSKELISLLKQSSIETVNLDKLSNNHIDFFEQKEIGPFEMPSISITFAQYKYEQILKSTGGTIHDGLKNIKITNIELHLEKSVFRNYINYGFDVGINTYNSNSHSFGSFDTMFSLHLKIPAHIKYMGDIAIRVSGGYGFSTLLGGSSGTIGESAFNDRHPEIKELSKRFGTVGTVGYGIDYYPSKWFGVTLGWQNRFYQYAKKNLKNDMSALPDAIKIKITNIFFIGLKTTI